MTLRHYHRILALIVMLGFPVAHPYAKSLSTAELLIFDNDWDSAGAAAILPILASPNWQLLGLTAVTGDAWRDQGSAELLRFLEQIGAGDLPVLPGAAFPLENTREKMLAWEKLHGRIPWKGAWNDSKIGTPSHPDQPYRIVTPVDGMPALHVSGESAVDFIIRSVRTNPHQVTIFAEGPLTNLALAIRRDPQIAPLSKRLVFTGANLTQIKRNDTVRSDFNFLFDPEAADVVLRAAWPDIISFGDIGEEAILTPELSATLSAIQGPCGNYITRHIRPGATLWGLLASSAIVNPAIVTRTLDLYLRVDLSDGPFRGRARAWLEANAPADASRVRVVRAIDIDRLNATILHSVRHCDTPQH